MLSFKPLAFAAVTKSSFRVSNMLLRVSLMNTPQRTKPRVSEGRRRYLNDVTNLYILPSRRLSIVYKPVWR